MRPEEQLHEEVLGLELVLVDQRQDLHGREFAPKSRGLPPKGSFVLSCQRSYTATVAECRNEALARSPTSVFEDPSAPLRKLLRSRRNQWPSVEDTVPYSG